MSLKDIEDSAQYTAFLITQENRRRYKEKKKKERKTGDFEVERIIKYKDGRVKLKWKDYKTPTWEPLSSVRNLKVWKDFKKKNKIVTT